MAKCCRSLFKENGDKEMDIPCMVQLISMQERGNPIAFGR